MLKKKLLTLALGSCLMASVAVGGACKGTNEVKAASGFTQNDFLKTDGTNIKNNYGKGNNVYLRGTNIGNLFVQESWMSSTDAKDQKTILESLTNRFGQDKALELLDYYESNYFTEDDFNRCRDMGMSVLRVPFTYMNLYKKSGSEWKLRQDAFKRLDWIVDQASQRGMYVILDLHGAFGSQNGQDHSGQVIDNKSDVKFFSDEKLKKQTLDLWKEVAKHYNGKPAVAGYDTLNEPGEKAGTTGETHWKFYNEMYNAIRSVDKDHIIIMESCWGTANLPAPSRYGWTNVVYEYHHYPWDFTSNTEASVNGQKNSIDNLVNSVNNANYGVPTYIGEFNCFDPQGAWTYTLEKMNKAGWHYTNWAYKSRGMGSWGIYHEKATKNKLKPASDSINTIQEVWGPENIGTNVNDKGITYNNMKPKLPGTVVMADTALDTNSYFAMKATINNKFVCADNYGESNLIADRDSYGEWEQFKVVYNNDNTVSFLSRVNNKYLCAVFDDTDKENPVIARSNQIGTWEKFYVEKQSDGTYALKTFVNNYYVQADINDSKSGLLHAIGASVGTWEKFTFEATNPAAIPGAPQQAEQPTQQPTQAPTQQATTKPADEVSIDVSTSSKTKFNNDYKVVAYYPNWYGDITASVQWDKLTHAYYAFGLPDGSGSGVMESLDNQKYNIEAMIRACDKNNVVPVLSVGGWSYSDGRLCAEVFEANTNTDAKCNSLAQSIVSQAVKNGFKGVDIDWEYPTYSSAANYTKFMKKLRELCNNNNMILTVAVAAKSGTGFNSEVLNLLDFVNIMAYDGDGGAGHSPYSLATDSFNYWKNTMGVPAKKLVIGVPFYERNGWRAYSELIKADPNNAYKDSTVINNQTVYYNGIDTMGKKAEYAANNAGGIMIWEISQDTSNSNLSLLNAIYNKTVSVVGKSGTTSATVSNLPGTINVKSYADKTDAITFTTNNSNVTYAGGLNDGSYLDYYINVAEAGKYTITLKLAAGDAQWNAKSFDVIASSKKSDGTAVSISKNIPVVGSTGWENFIDHNVEMDFTAKGTYKLTIKANGGACNVTDIVVTKGQTQTVAPTTVKPTVAPTTVAPTTIAQNIEIIAPFGVVASCPKDNVVGIVWGQTEEMVKAGYKYNVYVNDNLKLNNVNCGYYEIENISAPKATIKLEAVVDNKVSQPTIMNVDITGVVYGNVTVVPTTAKPTVAPTTVRPTQAPTTVKPTQAPTTTEHEGDVMTDPWYEYYTTQAPTTVKPTQAPAVKPLEVIGLVVQNIRDNAIGIVWGQDNDRINSGCKYNVYIDNELVIENGICRYYEIENVNAGNNVVTVKSVLNGVESDGITVEIMVAGNTYQNHVNKLVKTVDKTTQNTEKNTDKADNKPAVKSVKNSEPAVLTMVELEKNILALNNDNELPNSRFRVLKLRTKKTGKKNIKLTWNKVSGATEYFVYGGKCKTKYVKIATVKANKFNQKKLKKGKYYKYLVIARNAKGEVLEISKIVHAATRGGKIGNCKKLKLKKTKVKIKLNKTYKIKVKQIANAKKVKIKNHRKVSFESDNESIATVNKKGAIKALKKGKCYIYVYAQNGCFKKVKVTVK